jgi:hypothetical protein
LGPMPLTGHSSTRSKHRVSTSLRSASSLTIRWDTVVIRITSMGMDREIGKPFQIVVVVESAGRIAVGPYREAGEDRPPDVVI